MEWYITQSIALIAVILLHAGISTGVMLYRRGRQYNREQAVWRREHDLPSGVAVKFQDRSAQGVQALAGDSYFRNHFPVKEEELSSMPHDGHSENSLSVKEIEHI